MLNLKCMKPRARIPSRSFMVWRPSSVIVVLVALPLIVLSGVWAQFGAADFARPQTPVGAWQTYQQSFILKDKEIRFSFAYPQGWDITAHPDGYLIHVQNVAPFNNPASLPGGLPAGFVKISFMVDPKADLSQSLQGTAVSINGVSWKQATDSGGISGDRSMTLETVRDGVVFRIYAYIVGTGGKGSLFEGHLATLNQMIDSLTFQPTIPLEQPPDAPPPPVNGKPVAP